MRAAVLASTVLLNTLVSCQAFAVPAQSPTSAIEQAPYRLPQTTYEAFVEAAELNFPGPFADEAFRRDHAVEDWLALQDPGQIEASTMAYRVDGLRITGTIVRPVGGGRSAILLWARGGVGEAHLDPAQMVEMTWWARRGYVVVASNFRGAGGSEGADEFGGADVADLIALSSIAKALPAVDVERMYAIGFSRGGLMLYRAAAEGLPVRAFGTAGGVTDVGALVSARPDFATSFQGMMPDYDEERRNNFCRRSAACWPARFRVPVLIAHGAADRAVPLGQALDLAAALEAAERPYQLSVFGGAGHGLDGMKYLFFEQAHAFFGRTSAERSQGQSRPRRSTRN